VVKTHVSLFSGIGGFDLAAEALGYRTVLLVEKDLFCQKVLRKNFPGVPVLEDIHDVTKARVDAITGWVATHPGFHVTLTKDAKELLVRQCETVGGKWGEYHQPAEGIGDVTQEAIQEVVADAIGQPSSVRGDDQADEGEGGSGGTHTRGSGGDDPGEPRTSPDEAEGGDRSHFAVDLLTAGVPCQPASVAGKQRGKEDDRWLWGEALRVVQELRPRWVVFENPTGIVSMVEYDSPLEMDDETYTEADIRDMGAAAYQAIERTGRGILDEIVVSLESQGYEVWLDVHPACAVDAPHRRDRIFIVGYSFRSRQPGDTRRRAGSEPEDRYESVADPTQPNDGRCNTGTHRGRESQSRDGGGEGDVADAFDERPQSGRAGRDGRDRRCGRTRQAADGVASTASQSGGDATDTPAERQPGQGSGRKLSDWWTVEPAVGVQHDGLSTWLAGHRERWADGTWEDGLPRVAVGVPHRKEQLMALGNAVVPAQVYPILKAIADSETKRKVE